MSLVPPAQKDGFSYAGDSFYCEASNLNRHRRATPSELSAHFNGQDPENRAAHWYEAQLRHYGLPPSKVKGTAHKRLFDAVVKGGLAVPTHIQKIEADLKKEWKKSEREAKKTLKDAAGPQPTAKGTKRKANQVSTSTNVNVNVSVNVSSTGVVEVQAPQPTAKKPRAAPKAAVKTTAKDKPAAPKSKEKSTPAKSTPAATTAKPKQTATTTKKQPPAATASKTKPAKAATTSTTKQGPAAKPAKPAKPTAKAKPSTKQAAQASNSAPEVPQGENDIPPPPYSEHDPGVRPQEGQPSARPKIGLLNGRYAVSCPVVASNFPEYEHGMGLVATLDAKTLWLKFNFGVATGMMKAARPYEVDAERGTKVLWRGTGQEAYTGAYSSPLHIDTTVHRSSPVDRLLFLGDGRIQGSIEYGSVDNGTAVRLDFTAYRLFGQPMTSDISPTEARLEWARLGEDVNQGMDEDW